MAKKKRLKVRPAAKTPPKAKQPKTAKRAKAKPARAVKKARRSLTEEDHVALGRALVTQEEKLYMLFKEDYHARQIFEFLRVETVKDLEQFSPQEIVKRLSQPIQTTVHRIRQKLAEKNRHLVGDEAFVVEFKEKR